VLPLLLGGCASLDYYWQAAGGQFELWRRQRPIATVLDDPATPAVLRARLRLVERARAFAAAELALPASGSYTHYAALGREFVVWNVFATPALSLEPVASCFPLVGCLEYRGFFDRPRAERHAAALAASGHDVFVGGVAAYSTLGWFDDPLLDTMLRRDDAELLETLFHELAHQRVYLPGDTAFNEAYAMAVAAVGLERWYAADTAALAAWRTAAARDAAVVGLLLDTRRELAEVYGSGAGAEAQRQAKRDAFARLAARYAALKAGWGDDRRYDAWMTQDMNNAKLASVSTYHAHVPAFLQLLQQERGSFPAFHRAVEALAAYPEAVRHACLEALAAGHAGRVEVAEGRCRPLTVAATTPRL